MDEKVKYEKLKEKLKFIKTELDDLDSIYSDLCGLLKNGLLIDDIFVDATALKKLKDNTNEISHEIDNRLMYMINKKI